MCLFSYDARKITRCVPKLGETRKHTTPLLVVFFSQHRTSGQEREKSLAVVRRVRQHCMWMSHLPKMCMDHVLTDVLWVVCMVRPATHRNYLLIVELLFTAASWLSITFLCSFRATSVGYCFPAQEHHSLLLTDMSECLWTIYTSKSYEALVHLRTCTLPSANFADEAATSSARLRSNPCPHETWKSTRRTQTMETQTTRKSWTHNQRRIRGFDFTTQNWKD